MSFSIAPVSRGYGRGGKQLGVPTANLPQFSKIIEEREFDRGVYCGFAQLEDEKERIYDCVVNFGLSPTFVGQVLM